MALALLTVAHTTPPLPMLALSGDSQSYPRRFAPLTITLALLTVAHTTPPLPVMALYVDGQSCP
jgi:hypothetical protein